MNLGYWQLKMTEGSYWRPVLDSLRLFFESDLSVTCTFLSLFVIVCFLGYIQGLTPWLDPDSHLVNTQC